jgi:lipoprotein-anchoring transpeptidase ErfK/SrfK
MHPRRFLAVLAFLAMPAVPLSAEPQPGPGPDPVLTVETTGTYQEAPAPAASEAAPVVHDEILTEADAAEAAEMTPEARPAPPPAPTLHIDINLASQRMVVSENGKAKYTWAVSSGAYGYPTPTGTFQPSWMSKMWYSRQYDNAPMPHSIFFKNGAAIHATNSVHLLGRPASHGCVRLAPSNAAKLYAMVNRHGKERTRIVVHGKPKYAPPPRVAGTRNTPPRNRAAGRVTYGYSPYATSGAAPRFVYPGDAPRYYVQVQKRRNAAMKKRRNAMRQYYSAY